MEENVNQQQPETDLFEDHFKYQPATKGQRFLNWLVDNLFMQYGLMAITGRLVGELIVKVSPEFAYRIAYEENAGDIILANYLFGVFNYLIYYTICEKAFKGYTIGKLLTGTRAISEDGQELSFKQAILRSLSRLVPFEVLSGFATRPWHDSWTRSMVIKTR